MRWDKGSKDTYVTDRLTVTSCYVLYLDQARLRQKFPGSLTKVTPAVCDVNILNHIGQKLGCHLCLLFAFFCYLWM